MVERGHGSTTYHSLGKVLKGHTDSEEEFVFLKEDLKRISGSVLHVILHPIFPSPPRPPGLFFFFLGKRVCTGKQFLLFDTEELFWR